MAVKTIEERHGPGFGLVFEPDQLIMDQATDYQQLTVFHTPSMGNVMLLDGLVMVTDRDDCYYHESIVHPAATRATSVRNCLIIGGGDGGTARELARYDDCESIELCEIDAQVIQAAKDYFPTMALGLEHAKTKLHIGDGCAYVAEASDDQYDLIIIDSSEPIGPNGTLFTEDFYKDIKRVLRPQGIVVIQGGSTMWQRAELREIWDKLHKVFDNCDHYTGLTPTYPGGHWTFFVCGQALATEPVRLLPEGTQWMSPSNAAALLQLKLPFY